MAYFDLEDDVTTPDAEAENRRKVIGAIASAARNRVLGRPAGVAPPSLGGNNDALLKRAGAMSEAAPVGSPAWNNTLNKTQINTEIPTEPSPLPSKLTPPARLTPTTPTTPPFLPTRPATDRYSSLASQGPPQYHGFNKVLDILGTGTRIGREIETGTGMGSLGYQARLGQAAKQAQEEQATEKEQAGVGLTRAQTDETQARTESLRNPKPEKPENLQQSYADAVADAQQRGVDPAKDPKVQQIADAITALQRQPAAPKENKAVAGVLNGKPAWGVQTDKGWVDPQTQASIPGFQPAPSFAETGLYEPVETPTLGGGMAPGVFNRRTGQTTPMSPTKAPVPKEAQKQIDESLSVARGMDRLERGQSQILEGVQKRGQSGPLGGGPYLNGPESMQFVANHIAMTFGSVKGARIGRDIIEQHVKARDLDQSTEAAAQRVLAGGVITYTQAQQMMETAKINRRQAWQQAQDAAGQ